MFLVEQKEHLFASGNIFSHYILKNYSKNRENTMTKIIATYIRNINGTFIGISMCMPLGYIVYYHHVCNQYAIKNVQNISR